MIAPEEEIVVCMDIGVKNSMSNKILLKNFSGETLEVTLPELESIKAIICRVITGDEVLTIILNDDTLMTVDSDAEGTRVSDYNDGLVLIPLNRISEFNSCKDGYEMLERFQSN